MVIICEKGADYIVMTAALFHRLQAENYFANCLTFLRIAPQVPQDDWGGYPGDGKDDEIPCRRMRSSSYVKAMGDEESGDSDTSPKASPQKSVRPDALVKSVIRPRDLLDTQRYDTSN